MNVVLGENGKCLDPIRKAEVSDSSGNGKVKRLCNDEERIISECLQHVLVVDSMESRQGHLTVPISFISSEITKESSADSGYGVETIENGADDQKHAYDDVVDSKNLDVSIDKGDDTLKVIVEQKRYISPNISSKIQTPLNDNLSPADDGSVKSYEQTTFEEETNQNEDNWASEQTTKAEAKRTDSIPLVVLSHPDNTCQLLDNDILDDCIDSPTTVYGRNSKRGKGQEEPFDFEIIHGSVPDSGPKLKTKTKCMIVLLAVVAISIVLLVGFLIP